MVLFRRHPQRDARAAEDFNATDTSQCPPPSSEERLAAAKTHTATLLEAGDVDDILAKAVKAKRKLSVLDVTSLIGAGHVATITGEVLAKRNEEEGKRQRREVREAATKARWRATSWGRECKAASTAAGLPVAPPMHTAKKARIERADRAAVVGEGKMGVGSSCGGRWQRLRAIHQAVELCALSDL